MHLFEDELTRPEVAEHLEDLFFVLVEQILEQYTHQLFYQEKVYQLVTEGEANILEGKIAVTTPIAKGLMGKKVGEIAQVHVPAGVMEFKVLEISL